MVHVELYRLLLAEAASSHLVLEEGSFCHTCGAQPLGPRAKGFVFLLNDFHFFEIVDKLTGVVIGMIP